MAVKVEQGDLEDVRKAALMAKIEAMDGGTHVRMHVRMQEPVFHVRTRVRAHAV